MIKESKGATSGPLAKVAASLDYLDRAARVVRISTDAPVDGVDLRLPRHPADPKLQQLAKKFALSGPVGRLLVVLETVTQKKPD